MAVDASIPNAPGSLPLIGHTGALIRDPLRFPASAANVGDLVRIRIGPVKAVAVCDPDLLTYTAQVVNEVLRLHPPVWLLTRNVTEDTELGGHPVKAGSAILVSPYLIHHREDVFPDPARFDVDRWDESRVTRQALNALLPFGFGARKCIGDVFGMTELMLVLARVIPDWDLESVSGERARSSTSFVLSPREFAARLTKPAGSVRADRLGQPAPSDVVERLRRRGVVVVQGFE